MCRFEMDGKLIIMSELSNCYMMQIEPAYPIMLCVQKIFYSDTLSLMCYGEYLKHGGTKVGTRRLYSKVGELLKETDYDEGWECSWEILFPTLVANGIDLKKIVNIFRCVEVGDDEEYKTYANQDFVEMKSRGQLEELCGEDVEIYRNWVVSTFAGPKVIQEHTFDGSTGNKLWSEYKSYT